MLQRIFTFLAGVLCGAAIGAFLALLLTPDSGSALREQSRQWMDKTVQDSLKAAETRRQELKAELAAKTAPEKSITS